MSILNDLLNMSKSCVYGLINESTKEVYLTYTQDSLNSVVRLISENRVGIGLGININEFEYKVFEETKDRVLLKIRFNYWYDKLSNDGYKLLNKRKPIKFQLVTCLDTIDKFHKKRLLYAKLKSRYSEIIVGVFDNINECNEFINNYGDLYKIKLADNILTKEYYD